MNFQSRELEVQEALAELGKSRKPVSAALCVIPVKMTEAWFLFDVLAIRNAAGNPNGTGDLNLPKVQVVEKLSDPKALLHDALKNASGRTGRHLKTFNVYESYQRLGSTIRDFSPLRQLEAFRAFESNLLSVIEGLESRRKKDR